MNNALEGNNELPQPLKPQVNELNIDCSSFKVNQLGNDDCQKEGSQMQVIKDHFGCKNVPNEICQKSFSLEIS